jgi:flagellum-specific peptidoglycan hydrolase FlgJ
MQPLSFFAKFAPAAIASCQGTGLLVSVTLAQAALESGWAESYLARAGNNLGGIKASKDWKGATLLLPTHEEVKGRFILVQAAFRKYPSAEAYFADRVRLFRALPRYAALLKVDAYQAEAMLFTKTGYCTDTKYGAKLINIITQFNLTKYDK